MVFPSFKEISGKALQAQREEGKLFLNHSNALLFQKNK